MWPFSRRESPDSGVEEKSATGGHTTLATPDEALLAILGATQGARTAAGEHVGPQSALRVPAVTAAIRAIAETVASLNIKVMRLEPDGTSTDDTKHPANRVLARPNPWASRFSFLQSLCFDACRHGVGLAVAVRVRGELRELIRLRPGAMMVDVDLDTGEPSYRHGTRVYGHGDVVHLQPIPSDNGELVSLVSLAREGIGFASTLQRHGSRLFANGAKPGAVLALKGEASAEKIKNVKAAWNLAHGGEKSGGTAVVPEATYQQLTLTSVDAQYLDLWKFAILEVARAFRVPPQFLADLERTTHSNAEELSLQFVAYCVKPWCEMMTEALERVVFTPDERDTLYLEFDYGDLLRPNTQQLFEALSKATAGSAFLVADEARDMIGRGPMPGGDQLRVPTNTAPADAPPPEIPPPAAPPQATPPEPPQPPENAQ